MEKERKIKMKKVKTRADKDKYGELFFGHRNEMSEQYKRHIVYPFYQEYSKFIHIYRLTLDNLNSEFFTVEGEKLKLLGQLAQKLMLTQHVETGRYYKLPTKEVANGFEYTRELLKNDEKVLDQPYI